MQSVLGRELRDPPLVHGVLLSFYRLLWMAATLILMTAPALFVGRSDPEWMKAVAVAWFISVWVWAGRFGTHALNYWKLRWVYPNFSIATFRAFHEKSLSSLFHNFVAPVVSCYGDVNAIADGVATLDKHRRDTGVPDWQYLDIRIALKFADAEWEKKVRALIATADFAVVDVTAPSLNVLWELAHCVKFLPPERVMIIGIYGSPWPDILQLVRDYLGSVFPGESFTILEPVEYGELFFGTTRFRVRVFRRMTRVRRAA